MAALLHIAPYWRAQCETPPGWTFTGNIHASPDYMQYRVWVRQSRDEGMLVSNRFTSEPNRPHLPVAFYYVIGQVSRWTGVKPEWMYAYSGCLLAGGLVILLYAIARSFLGSPRRAFWVFMVILVGGGLGPHLKALRAIGAVQANFFLHRTLVEGLQQSMLFDDYRSHYVFVTLFDTHFLLIWLVAAAALLALWRTVERFSLARLGLTALLFGTVTVLHVYEGVTLMAAALGAVLFLWRKKPLRAAAMIALVVCAAVVAVCMAWQFLLYRSCGLPVPSWRGLNVFFSILIVSYPLAWWFIAWGIADYWRNAGPKDCFLLGLGGRLHGPDALCAVLSLSGPRDDDLADTSLRHCGSDLFPAVPSRDAHHGAHRYRVAWRDTAFHA